MHPESDVSPTLPLTDLADRPASWAPGWRLRLPVRAEQIAVDKQLVVYERVVVRRRELHELERIDATVRREELQVHTEGDVAIQ